MHTTIQEALSELRNEEMSAEECFELFKKSFCELQQLITDIHNHLIVQDEKNSTNEFDKFHELLESEEQGFYKEVWENNIFDF